MSIKTRLQKLEQKKVAAVEKPPSLVVVYSGTPPELPKDGRVRVLLPANGREAAQPAVS